jgi:hypothetical protein
MDPTTSSIEKPIRASFQWTRQEWLLVQRIATRYTLGALRFFWLLIVTVILVQVIPVFFRPEPINFNAIFLIIVLLAAFSSLPILTRFFTLRRYAERPDRDMMVAFTITDQSIHSKTDIASSEVSWNAFTRAIRLPKGFLLLSGRSFHWIPTKAFSSVSEVQQFADLTASKIRQYRDTTAERNRVGR